MKALCPEAGERLGFTVAEAMLAIGRRQRLAYRQKIDRRRDAVE